MNKIIRTLMLLCLSTILFSNAHGLCLITQNTDSIKGLHNVSSKFKPQSDQSILLLSSDYTTYIIEHKDGRINFVAKLPFMIVSIDNEWTYIANNFWSRVDSNLFDEGEFAGENYCEFIRMPFLTNDLNEITNHCDNYLDTAFDAWLYEEWDYYISAITSEFTTLVCAGSEYGGGAHGTGWSLPYTIPTCSLNVFIDGIYSQRTDTENLSPRFRTEDYIVDNQTIFSQNKDQELADTLIQKALRGEWSDYPEGCGEPDTADLSYSVRLYRNKGQWNFLAYKDVFAPYMCSNGDYAVTCETDAGSVPQKFAYSNNPNLLFPDGYDDIFLSPTKDVIYGLKGTKLICYSNTAKKYIGVLELEDKYVTAVQWVSNDTTGLNLDEFSDYRLDSLSYEIIDEYKLDIKPKFPGGDAAFMFNINEALGVLDSIRLVDIENTTLYVEYIIDSKGNVSVTKVHRSIHPIVDNSVIELLENSQKWKPGYFKGKAVNSRIILPLHIDFTM